MNFVVQDALLLVLIIILYCVVIYFWKVLRRKGFINSNFTRWGWYIIGFLFFILCLVELPTLIRLLWKSPESLLTWEDPYKVTAYGTVSMAVGTILLATSAYLAFIVAYIHLDKFTDVSKASFLLDLERQSTSESMLEAQTALAEEWQKIDTNVAKTNPKLGENGRDEKISELFNTILEGYRDSNNPADHLKYHVLIRNCDFYETVGVMVYKGYIDIEDVASRFEIAITRVHQCFHQHIKVRHSQMWASQKLFWHIDDLYEQTKKYIDNPNQDI